MVMDKGLPVRGWLLELLEHQAHVQNLLTQAHYQSSLVPELQQSSRWSELSLRQMAWQ